MDQFENMMNNLMQSVPNVIIAILLLLLAWAAAWICKSIVEKLFVKVNVHKSLAKIRIARDEEQGKSILSFTAKIVYLIVFILFLPAILDALNMNSVASPISNMMDKLLNFIPNIVAAAIILIIGYVIAKIVKELVEKLSLALKLDRWFNKIKPTGSQNQAEGVALSSVIANVVFVIILIPIITIALEALGVYSIAAPITSVLDQVLQIIPNIFVAIVLIIAGYYLANFLSDLLTNVLRGTGINNVYSMLNLTKEDNTIPFDLAKVLGMIVKVVVVLFFTVEALNLLQLQVLNGIGAAVITYIPFLVSGLLILIGGLLLGHFLSTLVRNYTNSIVSATIVKYIVIVFAVFMTLDQLQFATSIVNWAFILILGGLMIAFAISFGIGGRDFAKHQLNKVENKMNDKQQ